MLAAMLLLISASTSGVGNGMIIDAPTEGEPIRELPMSTAWYADSLVGAARP